MNSRIFKFRVFDKQLGRYISWNPFIQFDSDEYVIQQYTGLNTRGGEEIWEGDVVRYEGCLEYPFVGAVEYWNCSFIIRESKDSILLLGAGLNLEIVGTIFDDLHSK